MGRIRGATPINRSQSVTLPRTSDSAGPTAGTGTAKRPQTGRRFGLLALSFLAVSGLTAGYALAVALRPSSAAQRETAVTRLVVDVGSKIEREVLAIADATQRRTLAIARDPALGAALLGRDDGGLAEMCDRGVRGGPGADAVLIFDAAGELAATSTVRADGSVLGVASVRLRPERVAAVLDVPVMTDLGGEATFAAESGEQFDTRFVPSSKPVTDGDSLRLALAAGIARSGVRHAIAVRDGAYEAVFAMPQVRTLAGAGVVTMMRLPATAVAAIERKVRRVRAAQPGMLAVLLGLLGALSWTTANRTRRRAELALLQRR